MLSVSLRVMASSITGDRDPWVRTALGVKGTARKPDLLGLAEAPYHPSAISLDARKARLYDRGLLIFLRHWRPCLAKSSPWFVYILECVNGRLYTGITIDIERRFKQHKEGRGAMFTRLNRPRHMIGATVCLDRSEASRLEAQVKTLSTAQKRSLAAAWRQVYVLPTTIAAVPAAATPKAVDDTF